MAVALSLSSQLSVSKSYVGADMTSFAKRPLRVLQITDTHLGASADESLLGINTEQSFRDVLQTALAAQRDAPLPFDVIVATGDLSNDGSQASYQRFVRLVRDYFPDTPLAWLDGNHDDPAGMWVEGLPAPLEDMVCLGGWRLILLSTRVPREERGELPVSELQRLETLLAQAANTPTVVFMHHQPVPIGSAWIDQYKVANSDAFFDLLDAYPCVKAVSWGHVHQDFSMWRGDLGLYASPSTCVQFKPWNDDFAVDTQAPGYRVFTLHPSGRLETAVHRVIGVQYSVDLAAGGY